MAINNRYDFVMLFDVENGNPNGDPDYGNNPRVDSETSIGYITDVCLKRKIRNYVELGLGINVLDDIINKSKGYNILIKNDRTLNSKFKEAYEELGLKPEKKNEEQVRDYMCKNYFDVRAFGAVMTTKDKKDEKYTCGIVRGPVQINFAKSISPINIQDITITRQAKANEARMEKSGNSEMGRKSIVPYALYRAEGYISAALANKVTDLTEEDVELLWTAIINMFEDDHSAARGKMCMRKLYIFKHDNVLGNCQSHMLFDKIEVKEKGDNVPRQFSDYNITVDDTMPNGIEFISKI